MRTPGGIEVTPRMLSGKPVLIVTRSGGTVVAYVPLRTRTTGDKVLLADITIRELRSHGVELADLEDR